MNGRIGISAFLSVFLIAPVAVADMSSKKTALIAAMNDKGCMMTTAQGNVQMPELGVSRPEAIKLSREMMAEGIAKFATDEETL